MFTFSGSGCTSSFGNSGGGVLEDAGNGASPSPSTGGAEAACSCCFAMGAVGGNIIAGSSGRGVCGESTKVFASGDGERSNGGAWEFHGLSNSIDGIFPRVCAPFVVDHGLYALDVVVAALAFAARGCEVNAGALEGEVARPSSVHPAAISPRLLSSPPPVSSSLPDGPVLFTDNLFKSFATPSYVSWITDSAAVAFDERRPHIDWTQPPPNRPDAAGRGAEDWRDGRVLELGDGERGVCVGLCVRRFVDEELLCRPRRLSCLVLWFGDGRECDKLSDGDFGDDVLWSAIRERLGEIEPGCGFGDIEGDGGVGVVAGITAGSSLAPSVGATTSGP